MDKDERTPLRRAVDKLISDGKIKQDKDLQNIFNLKKSTISAYLSKPKPGKRFVNEFEKEFGISLNEFEVDHIHPLQAKSKIESLQIENLLLRLKQIEINLAEMQANQEGLIIMVKEVLKQSAKHKYEDNPKRLQQELEEINKTIGAALR